jgi:hypothetical protein
VWSVLRDRGLVKYLVEINTPIKCHFNKGWWKHALISPQPSGHEHQHPEIPTIVMFREPVSQVLSFYKLSARGGKALSGAPTLAEFISSPVHMKHSDGLIEYRFSSPVDYLVQYYHAALAWSFPGKAYVDLSELQCNPEMLRGFLAAHFDETGIPARLPPPARYLGRNPDVDFAAGVQFEAGTSLEQENEFSRSLRRQLTPSMIDAIKVPVLMDLYGRLRGRRLTLGSDAGGETMVQP